MNHRVSRFFQPFPVQKPSPKSLYLLKCTETGLYKIESTNGSVTTRISKLYYNSHVDKRTIAVVKTWDKLGYCEKYILADFEHILTPHPFYTNGHTEWFKFTGDESRLIGIIESILSSFNR